MSRPVRKAKAEADNDYELPDVDEDEEENYSVEKIINKRVRKDGKVEYLVKWANYSVEQSTWQTDVAETSAELVKEYEAEVAKQRKKNPKKTIGRVPISKVLDRVLMSKVIKGKHLFLVAYKSGAVEVLPAEDVTNRSPRHALEFYERKAFEARSNKNNEIDG